MPDALPRSLCLPLLLVANLSHSTVSKLMLPEDASASASPEAEFELSRERNIAKRKAAEEKLQQLYASLKPVVPVKVPRRPRNRQAATSSLVRNGESELLEHVVTQLVNVHGATWAMLQSLDNKSFIEVVTAALGKIRYAYVANEEPQPLKLIHAAVFQTALTSLQATAEPKTTAKSKKRSSTQENNSPNLPSTAKKASMGSSQTHSDVKLEIAQNDVARHLNDRFGCQGPHGLYGTNGYLLVDDKFLLEKIRKKWGNARAANERKANKALAEEHKARGAEAQPAVPKDTIQPVVTAAASASNNVSTAAEGHAGGMEAGAGDAGAV